MGDKYSSTWLDKYHEPPSRADPETPQNRLRVSGFGFRVWGVAFGADSLGFGCFLT